MSILEKEPIRRKEWQFVIIAIAVILVLTSLPYIYASLTAPHGKQFMGIMLDVPDHTQYFSWMRELKDAPLASNKLTPEPNKPIFFNLLWWGMGRISKLLSLSYGQVLQVLRISSTILFLPLVYYVCSLFFPDQLKRRTAFLIISFGSGLGWIWVVLKYTLTNGELLYPLDLYVAEGNTFLGILGYPHFIAAALYIFVFIFVLLAYETKKLRYAWIGGALALFFGWQHAYDLLLVYGVMFAFALLILVRDKKIPWTMVWIGLIVGGVSWWPALYSVLMTTLDPLWEEVLAQFANAGVYTPNLLHLPILMGIPFLLAVFTVIRENPLKLSDKSNLDLFLLGWFLINFGLVYLPVDYQIHMLNGWQVPIGILAVRGLFNYIFPFIKDRLFSRQEKQKVYTWLSILVILVVLPTNLYLLAWRFIDLRRYDYPYYLHQDELSALAWLEENTSPDDVVLSSLTLGQYIPAYSGNKAFLAHWAQTVDFFTKRDLVDQFYAVGTGETAMSEIVRTYSVDYVIDGPAERALGAYSLDGIGFLEQVFTSPDVNIYQVNE